MAVLRSGRQLNDASSQERTQLLLLPKEEEGEEEQGYVNVKPFIEHISLKSLRRVLKYSFRSVAIAGVLLFSSISLSAFYFLCRIIYFMVWSERSSNTHFLDHIQKFFGVFEAYLLIEALFLLGMHWRYKLFLAIDSSHLPRITRAEFPGLLEEFKNIDDPEAWVSGWFFGKSSFEISLNDFKEWTAATFFNDKPGNLKRDEWEMSKEFVQAMEKKLGHSFGEGNGEVVKKILLTLDQPTIVHRPLILYVAIRGLEFLCRILLLAVGFERITGNSKSSPPFPYYIRHGSSKLPPIVFFHGLGVGLSTYILFSSALAFSYPDRVILLFEMPSVQMKLDDNHVLPKDFAFHVIETIKKVLPSSNQKCIFAGHSLGTSCVAWISKFYPEYIHASLFVDPICFKLWDHNVAFNALYRVPSNFHEAFINLYAMTEAGHSVYLHRYFCWYQNVYLSKDLPKNSMIFLSEKDDIVETTNVLTYLLAHPDPSRKIFLFKSFHHGQLLASPEFVRVVAAFQALSD